MRARSLTPLLSVVAATVVVGTLLAAPAVAQGGGGGGGGGGRSCGPTTSTGGAGSLGSSFSLKSKYDDDAAGAAVQVGEEFEVNTQVAGQVWTLTFTYNGTTFFTGDVTSTTAGVRQVERALYTGGTSHMAVHAVSQQTGEVVDGSVDDAVAPARCGR
jgi:hypothetical protein